MYTQFTGQSFQLGQDVISRTTYTTILFTSVNTIYGTEGVIKLNSGEQSEWIVIDSLTPLSPTTYQATVVSRGLKKDAVDFQDVDAALQKDHSIGTPATFVTHSIIWNNKIRQDEDNTFTGNSDITGSLSFTGTTEAGLIPQSVTTTQRDNLTGTDTGQVVYNTTTQTGQYQNNSNAWVDVSTGATTPNATETSAGRVKLGTILDQQYGTQNTTVVQTQYLTSGFDQINPTSKAGTISILGSDGTYDRLLFPNILYKFGGTGDDGALTMVGVVIIPGNGYVVQNYTRISGPTQILFSGTEVFAHIKVQGDCDLTNCTIDLKGKGGAGGAGGTMNLNAAANNGANGSIGAQGISTLIQSAASQGGSGAQFASAPLVTAGTTLGVRAEYLQNARMSMFHTGNGGGGGGGAYNNTQTGGSTTTPSGGNGGSGGGVLLLEVGGNINFTNTIIDCRGNDGLVGIAGTTDYNGGGGGGGGAGGAIIVLYNGTIIGSPTLLLNGGVGGLGGSDGGAGGFSGGGGAGGSSVTTTGSSGSAGTSNSGGGTGGAGALGVSYIQKNQVFS